MARRPASRLCARRSAPSRQLALNAGEDGSIIVGKMIEKDRPEAMTAELPKKNAGAGGMPPGGGMGGMDY